MKTSTSMLALSAAIAFVSGLNMILIAFSAFPKMIYPDRSSHPLPQDRSNAIANIAGDTPRMRRANVAMFPNVESDGNRSQMQEEQEATESEPNRANVGDLSVVILTYNKYSMLDSLLDSIEQQETEIGTPFETIVVDNGCLEETKKVVSNRVALKYLPLCNNRGYAHGNNEGVKMATGRWILFLNDDIVLQPGFIKSFFELLNDKPKNMAAIGCKILNEKGNQVIEAGSIVWNKADALGYGRGRLDVHASDLEYPRPVDYVSGACLLVERTMFLDYGGFDGETFPSYYEDTDFQMHIQHDLGKEVWLQPKAVALHGEHSSFGASDAVALMQKGKVSFRSKWKRHLSDGHLPNPGLLPKVPTLKHEQFVVDPVANHIRKASDLRARKQGSILYLDQLLPNHEQGAGFGRAFDNVAMLSQDLGYMVTVVTTEESTTKAWCEVECRQNIIRLGVELPESGSPEAVEKFMLSRIGFYDIVLVSRPQVMEVMHSFLRSLFIETGGSFAIVYDSEALGYRRDELMMHLSESIPFPGALNIEIDSRRKIELTLAQLADVTVMVSEAEGRFLAKQIRNETLHTAVTIKTIGHIMEIGDRAINAGTNVQNRSGILFLGAFHDSMYYNGDAIWYFLKEIFPLILQESPVNLTIAGRGIPDNLRTYVEGHGAISAHVQFIESPADTTEIYKTTRAVLAPHLYAAGVQFKISEAMSRGIPVVMSALSAEAFEIKSDSNIGCVGHDPRSFKDCVLKLNNDKNYWQLVSKSSVDFIQQTHARSTLTKQWADILDTALLKRNARISCNFCNQIMSKNFADPKSIIQWQKCAEYDCDSLPHGMLMDTFFCKGCQRIVTQNYEEPNNQCEDGEQLYLEDFYPDVGDAVKKGELHSGFHHFKLHGREEGRRYVCPDTKKIWEYKRCMSSCI
mmetsp:Transcript_4590/g.9262  ORF Transcript_4590/g.9262 Transcript_4590/m.9262 type:complete len:914 (-) Transcript_4590:172-2913(-)|eukprot:scaffold27511_cov199-Amphora_coffeaeformis.AAC.4